MSAPSYVWDFSFLWGYRWLILWGLGVTILYTIGTILLGLVVGLATGLLRLSRNKFLNAPLVAYVEIFRCTPLLVQIIWFYYALPVVLGIDIPATLAAVLVLSLYTGAFYAEIVRGGVNSIERGQWDAARAIGMRRGQVMRYVILPQAVKRMEEYLSRVDNRGRRSPLRRADDHRRDLSAARSLHDGGGDLFRGAVPADLDGARRRIPPRPLRLMQHSQCPPIL